MPISTIDIGISIYYLIIKLYSRTSWAVSENSESLRKNHFLSMISFGDAQMTYELTTVSENKLEPSSTANAIWIPSTSASSLAERLAKTSGDPAPNARSVTPARDSEILNVFDMLWSEGDKNSSATWDKKKNAIESARTYWKLIIWWRLH